MENAEILRLAVEAECDQKTVRRFLKGLPVKLASERRILLAASRLRLKKQVTQQREESKT